MKDNSYRRMFLVGVPVLAILQALAYPFAANLMGMDDFRILAAPCLLGRVGIGMLMCLD